MDLDKQLDTILEYEADDTDNVGTTVVFRNGEGGLQVLLTKRSLPPAAGQWALPGGHLKIGEKPIDGAKRELYEETGLKPKIISFVQIQHSDNRRGREEHVFVASVPASSVGESKSDSKSVKWVSINKLPPLAFNHIDVVHDAVARFNGTSSLKEYYIPKALFLCEEIDEAKKLKKTVQNILDTKHQENSGLLIVFEGCDGVGKSTQCDALCDWLEDQGYAVNRTKWNSSKLLNKAINKAKDKKMLSPMLYCLLHAADMLVRYQEDIIPALERNEIVVSDRYWYTSSVRDQVRGVDASIDKSIYKGMREPDLILHCVCPIEVAFSRMIGGKGLSFYGTGMDMNLSPSKEESCIKYGHMMDRIYREILPKEKNYKELNMNRTIKAISADVKKIIGSKFGIGKYSRK